MAPKSNCASTPCCFVRYWNCGAVNPCAISGSAAPSRSSMSSVGGWKVEARDSSLRSGPASNTVTGTPPRTRLAAAVSPTGPAPAIKMRFSIAMMVRRRVSRNAKRRAARPSLDRLDARLGDDVAPFDGLGGYELAHLLRGENDRLSALLGEFLSHRRIGHRC